MKKFVYFLSDSPTYPNEIYANSPTEVKKLILESVPDESQILKIIEMKPNQSDQQMQNQQNQQQIDANVGQDMDPNDFKNANDFFNNVMNAAIKREASKPIEKPIRQIETKETSVKPIEEPVHTAPKFFEEAGIQFKLENGKLFKKSWVNVSDDDMPQFRIKVRKTGKLADEDKFVLEKLEWVEIKS